MLKNFNDYLNEDSTTSSSFTKELASSLISRIKQTSGKTSDSYIKIKTAEFINPLTFDIELYVRRDSSPRFDSDSHFKNLPWEKDNFDSFGFSIDANTYMDRDENIVPEIQIVILINPDKEPTSYSEMYFKLIDTIAHELHHLTQAGWNRQPNRTLPSNKITRKNAKTNYKYFLLNDEIESMVTGMYTRAKSENKELDVIFDQYLMPFIKYDYLTQDQYTSVITSWIKYAVSKYPGVKFSSKVKEIVNSI